MGGKGGRWWPWPVVCGLWRSWEEFAMTFCGLFVSQGVLEGLFEVFLHFLTVQAPTAAAIAAGGATGEVRAGAGGPGP